MKTDFQKTEQLPQNEGNRVSKKNIFDLPNLVVRSTTLVYLTLLVMISGCDEFFNQLPEPSHLSETKYKQVNLVSDTSFFSGARIDNNLANAWGIAINPAGIPWICSNGKGLSVVYDKNGMQKRPPVAISSQGMPNGGAPTGVVFNSTSDFIIPVTMEKSKFIFVGEDGKIYAWSSGDSTRTVADRSAWGAVYKGVELANDGTSNYLFATNFHDGTIDVFDKNFTYVNTKPFMDASIPMGFAPFNIRLIDGMLYVTYAKQKTPAKHDDMNGPGNGYVNIFTTDGSLVKRFVSTGKLNSPWGIEKAPESFGVGKHAILIGNFGDGYINVFEEFEGEFQGQLKSKTGGPVWIDGLWAITFPDGNIPGDNPNKLYFTAGPFEEGHGLFGYLSK